MKSRKQCLDPENHPDLKIRSWRYPDGISMRSRFLSKIEKPEDGDGCWEWVGHKTKSGYGVFGVGESIKLAHRVSLRLHVGIVPDNLHVCHRCDNPSCVRPSHLFLGTDQENTDDKVRKGRHIALVRRKNMKLSGDDVALIVCLLQSGWRIPAIAARFVVSRMCIYNIRNNKRWTHIKRPEVDTSIKGSEAVARGVDAWNSKLTVADVIEIRSSYVPRRKCCSGRALAKKFGVPFQTISNIVRRATWFHIKDGNEEKQI